MVPRCNNPKIKLLTNSAISHNSEVALIKCEDDQASSLCPQLYNKSRLISRGLKKKVTNAAKSTNENNFFISKIHVTKRASESATAAEKK
jgi:hypothetical protein